MERDAAPGSQVRPAGPSVFEPGAASPKPTVEIRSCSVPGKCRWEVWAWDTGFSLEQALRNLRSLLATADLAGFVPRHFVAGPGGQVVVVLEREG